MKDMNSNLFQVRLSNLLAKSMGFNMPLEFSRLDDTDDDSVYWKPDYGSIKPEPGSLKPA